MDKNTITGFVLIALVLIGFSWWSSPSTEEQRAAFVKDSIATAQEKVAKEKLEKAEADKAIKEKMAAIEDTNALFHNAFSGNAQDITLKNDKVELTFSTKGATVKKVVLKGFKDCHNNPNLTLFDTKEQQLNFLLAAKESNISTQSLYFTPSNLTDTTVVFTAEAASGKTITMAYALGCNYMLHLSMRANGMEGLFHPSTSTMDIDWYDKCRQQEKGFTFENRYASLTWHHSDGGTDYLRETSNYKDEPIEKDFDWVAFKNQFFSVVMIAKNDFKAGALATSIPQEKGSGYLKQYELKAKTFFDPSGAQPSEFEFYYGPNDFHLLETTEKQSTFGKDLQMQDLVYLGWTVFRFINRWFTLPLFELIAGFGLNMAIVLILITFILKGITFPLVKKSYMSSAKMRVLKPRLEAATAQFNKPEDAMQKQQAMMAEYAKYGVSPLSGCLPMFIQMPIWIAMFQFVPNAIQLRGQSFLWIEDLSTYDPIIEWGTNLWLIGDHLSLTCILFCAGQLLYSWAMNKQQRDQMVGAQAEQLKMMQWMMYLMPLMFFFMFNDYSSGLNFYYFISLFMSATIMFVLRKTTNDEKLLANLDKHYQENKNNPRKQSGLAARLQAMQQQQMEMQHKREELERKKRNLGK